MKNQEKHEFAVYCKQLPTQSQVHITDKDLYHRIINILRMQVGEQLILFNRENNVTIELINITKKDLQVKVLHQELNKKLEPKITVGLSLLKREAFEEAIYYCVEMGANIIQPVITQKVHAKNFDRDRLERIIISAAEQSKNFNFPELLEPKKLSDLLPTLSPKDIKVFFDAGGQNLIMQNLHKNAPIFLLIGPEGDLSQEEKETLKNAKFEFICLTPTILRAQTAVALGLGMFRSFLQE